MSDSSREKLEKNLLKDVNDLVREGDEGAEGFLKSLTDLVESEKYKNITSHLDDSDDEIFQKEPAVKAEAMPEEDDLEEIMAVIAGGKTEKISLGSTKETEEIQPDTTKETEEIQPDTTKETGAILPDSAKETVKDQQAITESEAVPAEDGEDNKEKMSDIQKKKKKKNVIYDLIMIACICVFIYCVGRIAYYYYTGWQYNKENKVIQDMVGDLSHKIIKKDPVVITDTDIYFPDELVYASVNNDPDSNLINDVSDDWKKKYASLVEHNPDCVGYIQIPDTKVNYPVMYTPGDYEKYLYKNFEGNYQFRGLPFMAEYTLLNRSQNYILYGHNMNDGSAFGNLKFYLQKSWAESHPYCYFNTAYSEGIYQVMAVVLTKIYNVEDDCFKYYKYVGELSEEDFNTYVYYMKKMSQYDTGVDAVWGDQLLSLSTCHRVHDPEGRLVVVFKRIQ